MFKKVFCLFLALLTLFSFSCARNIEEISESSIDESSSLSYPIVIPETENEEKENKSFLWEITDKNGSVIWLFGCSSVGSEDSFDLPEIVTSAFSESSVLAVDYDTVALANDLDLQYDLMMNYQTYSGEASLIDVVGADVYSKTLSLLLEYEVFDSFYDKVKAVFIQELLDNLVSDSVGLSMEFSAKTKLLNSAKLSNKSVDEIEGAKNIWQIKASLSNELQTFMLSETVDGINDGTIKESRIAVKAALENGDTKTIEALTQIPEEMRKGLYEEYYQKMIESRNKTMTDYCVNQLESKTETFVCVGLNHIIGDDGIAASLQKLGYNVERKEHA